MVSVARKGMLVCGAVALCGGGLAGIGLANYAQSGAFDFYKQAPPPVSQSALAASADSAGYYPLSRAAATPAYPENPSPRIAIARPAQPADYRRPPRIAPDAPPAIEEAALPEEDAPVIAPQRGSWSAPEDSTPAPAEAAVVGDTSS